MTAPRPFQFALAILIATPLPSLASVIHVPSEQPTIQAGIDAASYGDTVLVACGTYYEHDILMKSGIRLVSETGYADCVTIDAQNLGRVMYCSEISPGHIQGFTLENGLTTGSGGGMECIPFCQLTIEKCTFRSNAAARGGGLGIAGSSWGTVVDCLFEYNTAENVGGGMRSGSAASISLTDCRFQGNSAVDGGGYACWETSWAELINCVFSENYAASDGGGLSCHMDSDATLDDCLFVGNHAGRNGGAISCTWPYTAAPTELTHCTLSGNRADGAGGGIYCSGDFVASIDNTIIAFSTAGEAVYCGDAGSVPNLMCCDLYGNAGGDWVGCIADQYGVNGNFSVDPLFCLEDNPEEPYGLHEGSPCLPENNPCGELVGAFGQGCGAVTAVEAVSWSAIKAMYR